MGKRAIAALFMLAFIAGNAVAAKVNTEKKITVDNKERKYVLYVPDNVKDNAPLVISLHGAAGHDTDRSPFRTSVADSEGCIVVYPQGNDQFFPVFGGSTPGWNASGEVNEDTEFFMSRYTLNDKCDKTLKWRLNIDADGFDPRLHNWIVSNGGRTYYSISGQPLSSPTKGVNIVRQSDGSAKKVLVNP